MVAHRPSLSVKSTFWKPKPLLWGHPVRRRAKLLDMGGRGHQKRMCSLPDAHEQGARSRSSGHWACKVQAVARRSLRRWHGHRIVRADVLQLCNASAPRIQQQQVQNRDDCITIEIRRTRRVAPAPRCDKRSEIIDVDIAHSVRRGHLRQSRVFLITPVRDPLNSRPMAKFPMGSITPRALQNVRPNITVVRRVL